MRAVWLLVLGWSVSTPGAAALYRHADSAGNVTYSDRPAGAGQAPLRLPPPNVATPEARRQLEIARQVWQREARADYEARIRRWAAAQTGALSASYVRVPAPGTPIYSTPLTYTLTPAYFVYPATVNARTPDQFHPPQGLRSAAVSHRAHSARR